MLTNRKYRGKGFTLVEILIVVVILGILAAIVVPQFTNAANESRTGNAVTQTTTIETQLELYAARNNGQYPSIADLTADPTSGGTNGWSVMVDGDYLKAAPINPFTGTASVSAMTATDPEAADTEADIISVSGTYTGAGWIYSPTEGLIRAAGADYEGDG